VCALRPPSFTVASTGTAVPVALHLASTRTPPSGSYRHIIVKSVPSSRPASSVTAANTSAGGVACATSVTTRRSAACSPVIRSSPARPCRAAILRSLSGAPARLRFRNAPYRINESVSVDGDELVEPGLPAEPSQSPGQSASEKVAMAASAVAWLEVLLEGLRNGTRGWAEWDESLPDTPDRADVAIRRCEAELVRASAELRALTRSASSDDVPGTELPTGQHRSGRSNLSSRVLLVK